MSTPTPTRGTEFGSSRSFIESLAHCYKAEFAVCAAPSWGQARLPGVDGAALPEMKKVFGERVPAKKDGGVENIAGQAVPKQGERVGKTRGETGKRSGVETAESPQGEIGDHEELQRSQQDGAANTRRFAGLCKPAADGDAGRKAQVDDKHQLIKAYQEISGKQRRERQHKGRRAIAKKRAGKDGHGADGCEVDGMRKNAYGCGDENQHRCGYELQGVETAIDIFI